MHPPDEGASPGDAAGRRRFDAPLDDFRLDKSKGRSRDSGHYQRNVANEVERFVEWYDEAHGRPPTFDDLDVGVFRQYARALRSGELHELRDGTAQPARSTVRTNYANISAYVGWCVDEGFLPEQYADAEAARDPLPSDDGRRSGDQQAWTAAQRQQLLAHVEREIEAFLDSQPAGDLDDVGLLRWRRDRALVHVLAYSGIRGGELLRSPRDERRTGVTWRDVSLADNRMTVLAKRQDETWSDRGLPPQTIAPLRQLEELLDPPTDDWPVFPTFHAPSLYDRLRSASALDDPVALDAHPLDLCRREGVAPPSLTTEGARTRLEQLTDDAGIEVEDDHGYLTMHGARRGVGEVLVREKGFAAAARQLDDTERMVRERYSHIEAGELAREVGDAFDRHDG